MAAPDGAPNFIRSKLLSFGSPLLISADVEVADPPPRRAV
jgi:hypothetical protein